MKADRLNNLMKLKEKYDSSLNKIGKKKIYNTKQNYFFEGRKQKQISLVAGRERERDSFKKNGIQKKQKPKSLYIFFSL